jgi:hypothetical protein
MVERWKIIDGGNAIEAIVAFEDPGAFHAPWSEMRRFQPTETLSPYPETRKPGLPAAPYRALYCSGQVIGQPHQAAEPVRGVSLLKILAQLCSGDSL